MASAFIGHWIVLLPGLFHGVRGRRDCRVDSTVVSAVKSINRRGDVRDIFGRRAVEYERRVKIFAVGRKTETLSAAPTEAGHRQLSVGSWKLLHIVSYRIQIRSNHVRIKAGDRFHRILPAGKNAGAAAVRTKT